MNKRYGRTGVGQETRWRTDGKVRTAWSYDHEHVVKAVRTTTLGTGNGIACVQAGGCASGLRRRGRGIIKFDRSYFRYTKLETCVGEYLLVYPKDPWFNYSVGVRELHALGGRFVCEPRLIEPGLIDPATGEVIGQYDGTNAAGRSRKNRTKKSDLG